MNITQLDQRIEKDIKSFEKSLKEYDVLLRQVSKLRSDYEAQITNLTQDYRQKIASLVEQFENDKEMSSAILEQNKSYALECFNLINEIQSLKTEFEEYRKDLDQSFKEDWEQVRYENSLTISDQTKMFNAQINELDARIGGQITKTTQEIAASRNETAAVKKEVLLLLSKEIGVLNEMSQGISSEVTKNKSDFSQVSEVLVNRLIDLENKNQNDLTNMRKDIVLVINKEIDQLNELLLSKTDALAKDSQSNVDTAKREALAKVNTLEEVLRREHQALFDEVSRMEKEAIDMREGFNSQVTRVRSNFIIFACGSTVAFGVLVVLLAGGWL